MLWSVFLCHHVCTDWACDCSQAQRPAAWDNRSGQQLPAWWRCVIVYALLCRQQQLASYITLIAMLQMQAAIVCLKLVSYTLLPMLFAVTANGMRKNPLVQSAQAGFDLVTLENRMWELFPVILMIAISSALLIEVRHPLSLGACWCTLDVNAAGQICLTSCGMVSHRACTCLMSG